MEYILPNFCFRKSAKIQEFKTTIEKINKVISIENIYCKLLEIEELKQILFIEEKNKYVGGNDLVINKLGKKDHLIINENVNQVEANHDNALDY